MTCLILDDEPLAVQLMEHHVNKVPGLELAGSFTEPMQAIALLEGGTIDLLFTDVKMPDITGVELIRSLRQPPAVVFTTAFSEFALVGYELNAVDFLMKPIAFNRFLTAVNKAKEFVEFRRTKTNSGRDYFFINASHKINKVFYSDVLYLEGFKDYTKIFLQSQANPLVVLHNLKYFEEFLPATEFVRIHRSYVVPITRLNTITRKQVTIGTITLPVSDMYRDRFFQLIGQ